MNIMFQLEEHETTVTPMKIADALINVEKMSIEEIEELVSYLTIYAKYHPDGR